MNLQQKKKNSLKSILMTGIRLALLVFVLLALVALPYRFDHKLGVLGYSVAIADDNDQGGNDNDQGESDNDQGENDNDQGEDDDDQGEDDDGEGQNDDNSSTNDQGDEDSGNRYIGSSPIGGITELTPVSPDEEADLVDNWDDSLKE